MSMRSALMGGACEAICIAIMSPKPCKSEDKSLLAFAASESLASQPHDARRSASGPSHSPLAGSPEHAAPATVDFKLRSVGSYKCGCVVFPAFRLSPVVNASTLAEQHILWTLTDAWTWMGLTARNFHDGLNPALGVSDSWPLDSIRVGAAPSRSSSQ